MRLLLAILLLSAAPAGAAGLLGDLLADGEDTRQAAVQRLHRLKGGEKRALAKPLAEVLGRGDAQKRSRAALALWMIGEAAADAVPALDKALADESVEVRTRAAAALGKIGPGAAAAVPNLIALSRQSLVGLKTTAITSLGLIGDARAAPVLAELLDDPIKPFARRAAVALGGIGRPAAAAAAALEDKLDDADPRMSAQCALALARVRPDAASAKAVAKLLRHDTAGVRLGAAEALGEIGPPAEKAVAALRRLAERDEPNVSEAAKAALVRITGRR